MVRHSTVRHRILSFPRAPAKEMGPYRCMLLGLLLCVGTSVALPVLEPCEEAARAGRWGLCADAAPVTLRGSNYIRLGGPGLKG